ncbi:Arginine biosynthesis bifunctional protein ArgJ, chloroplastic-like protein, partial [Drosera capensis]
SILPKNSKFPLHFFHNSRSQPKRQFLIAAAGVTGEPPSSRRHFPFSDMYRSAPHQLHFSVKFPHLNPRPMYMPLSDFGRIRTLRVCASLKDAGSYIPAATIKLPDGPWQQIAGGVAAAKGFKAAGMYGGLRAQGEKPDLALVTCDVDAVSAGAFTTNVVAAAPVVYCKEALRTSITARAVLINAGQANAATGDAGYQDVIDSADALAEVLEIRPGEVLIESTGVIGHRIKKEALINSLPKLVASLSSSTEGADSAAVAITTTDLVSKSVAAEFKVGQNDVRIGGMAKGSGMIHPNMATMLGVDGDCSTNDTVIALASGLSGSSEISSLNSDEAKQLQACLDVVMQGLAKSIASDGEGATCLIEVRVTGAGGEAECAKIARSVASSSLTKAAVYGRDPNWGRIACAAGYAGVPFNPNDLRISLGDILLMDGGQPLPFDRAMASGYLKKAGETHGTVKIRISVGKGPGEGKAWGCDLSYDYVKINAEYTT